ncbi:MAG: hypothetical protein WCC03_16875 [Candidatus Acidiferrales bacterium]
MVRSMILVLALSSAAFAQEASNTVVVRSQGMVSVSAQSTPIQGAPYSATITNESIQTLTDGNRIVQTSTGTTARDAQGRSRQDTALPAIGNLSAANAPHLVFIQDPVAQASYVLNLTDKTAQRLPMPPAPPAPPAGSPAPTVANAFFIQSGTGPATAAATMPMAPPMALQRTIVASDQDQVATEDLGSQTMEGIVVNGIRTTRTIPAGQIGNDKPISIVTEVWTSPDLKTVISSKRNDPRMGEQTFQLTNIVRAEPDPSLFAVPSDFKIIDGPQKIVYRSNQ